MQKSTIDDSTEDVKPSEELKNEVRMLNKNVKWSNIYRRSLDIAY